MYEATHKDDVDDQEPNAVGATHLIDHRHERTEPRCASAAINQHFVCRVCLFLDLCVVLCYTVVLLPYVAK